MRGDELVLVAVHELDVDGAAVEEMERVVLVLPLVEWPLPAALQGEGAGVHKARVLVHRSRVKDWGVVHEARERCVDLLPFLLWLHDQYMQQAAIQLLIY